MRGDKQRRKERDGGERRGEERCLFLSLLTVPTVRGCSLLPRLSLKNLPLISSSAACKTCSTFDLPDPITDLGPQQRCDWFHRWRWWSSACFALIKSKFSDCVQICKPVRGRVHLNLHQDQRSLEFYTIKKIRMSISSKKDLYCDVYYFLYKPSGVTE